MNIPTILISLALLAGVCFALRSIRRHKGGCSGCSGCDGCAACSRKPGRKAGK